MHITKPIWVLIWRHTHKAHTLRASADCNQCYTVAVGWLGVLHISKPTSCIQLHTRQGVFLTLATGKRFMGKGNDACRLVTTLECKLA